MKKFLKIFSIVAIFCTFIMMSNVFAATADVQINGQIIDFTDSEGNKVEAQLINSRTMVPLRKIFEVLGCEIDWNGETKTVTASKAEKQIVLQIDNLEAKIIEAGLEKIITLDTAPIILNNRTLVPLRFVAESLEKQVGWDSSSYTAIIIDYDYFTDLIKQKNASLHEVLNTSKTESTFSITRNYTDKIDSKNNTTAILNGKVEKQVENSKITLDFSGTDELMKEISSEGWAHIEYEAKYDENKILVKTTNETFQKMLNMSAEDYTEFDVQKFNVTGNVNDNLSKAIQNLIGIGDSKLRVSSFEKMKTEFNKILNLFLIKGTRNLNYENAKLESIDYTKFDNIVYENEVIRTLTFINQTVFHYDVLQDELLYDWSSINYTLSCENDSLVLKIVLENEYNEKVEYIINIY